MKHLNIEVTRINILKCIKFMSHILLSSKWCPSLDNQPIEKKNNAKLKRIPLMKFLSLMISGILLNASVYGMGINSSLEKSAKCITVKAMSQRDAATIAHKLNQGEDDEIIADEIRIAKDFRLSWKGKGVLILKSKEDIIFEEGSFIESLGKGGLILHPNCVGNQHTATVKFLTSEASTSATSSSKASSSDDSDPAFYIDFSRGRGSISLFYNPKKEKIKHSKYRLWHPIDWTPYIKTEDHNYFQSFMFINNSTDLADINENLEVNFVLSKPDISTKDVQLDVNFEGYFLYNMHYFFERGMVFAKYPRLGHDVFFELFPNRYDHRVLYFPLPLRKKEREIFKLIKHGNKKTFAEQFKSYNTEPLINERGETLLHFAIRMQQNEIIHHILSYFNCKINQKMYLKELLERQDLSKNTPLMVAIRYVDPPIVAKLYGIYERQNITPPLDLLRGLALERVQKVQIAPTDIAAFLQSCTEAPASFGRYWQGVPVATEAENEEYKRQQSVTRKFFAILFTPDRVRLGRTQVIFNAFYQLYRDKKEQVNPFNLNGLPSRSRIILMYNILTEKLKTYYSEQKTEYWKRENRQAGSVNDEKSIDLFPTTYAFGVENHKFTNKPTVNKPGYTYYHQIGTYQEDIIPELESIKDRIQLSELAKLFQTSRLSGNPLTSSMLYTSGYQGKIDHATSDANFLNRLQLLLDLEIVSRLYVKVTESTPFDQLPIGISCARCFTLCRTDQNLTFLDILKLNSLEGNLFEGVLDARKEAISQINLLSHQRLKGKNGLRRISSSTESAQMDEWEKTHPYGRIIGTAEELHQELLEEYGGGYESDGLEYQDN